MSNYTLSPNMNLLVPTVGVDPGPEYASDVNTSLTLVDGHDHSIGYGVQIQPAGLNINSDLTFQGHQATNLAALVLTPQTASPASTALFSMAAGTSPVSDELFYTDSNGITTQITKNGFVNAIATSLPGESYSSGTFIWTQTQDSLPTTPANFSIGSLTLAPNVAATPNSYTLTPPATGVYDLSLPIPPATTSFTTLSPSGALVGTYAAPVALPSATSFLTMSPSGAILNGAAFPPTPSVNSILTMDTSGVITASIPTANNITTGVYVNYASGTNTSPSPVSGLSTTITTQGKPVMVSLQSEFALGQPSFVSGTTNGGYAIYEIYEGSSILAIHQVGGNIQIPVTTISGLSSPPAGVPTTYTIRAATSNASYPWVIAGAVLVACELNG